MSESKETLLNQTDRTEYLSAKANNLEDRLRRSRNSGKDANDSVKVTLTGGKKVNSIEIDHKELGIKKSEADDISERIIEATNRALERYENTVAKEIEKIID